MSKAKKQILYEEEPESDSEMELEQEPIKSKNNPQPEQKKYINNELQMNEKLLELQNDVKRKIASKKPIFHDFMAIVSEKTVQLTKSQVDDDIQREVVLYNIALENTKKAIAILEKEGIKTQRPDDFLAEMYKKDQVMQKIKNRLVKQQVKIQNFEEKKTRMENKKFAKHLKTKKEQEKHREKKKNVEAIDQWKEEIHRKGDKAKDLSEFVLKSRKKERDLKNPRSFKGKTDFNNQENIGEMSRFSKKIQKGVGSKNTSNSQRLSRKKQPKSKRPGKVTRIIMKNKKFSGKNRKS